MSAPARLTGYLLVLLAAWCVQVPLAHSALIELQPGLTFAETGDSISLDLVVSDLGNFAPDSLGAFDISVGFDPSRLSFTGYALGDFLGDIGLAEAIDASAGDVGGAINIAEVSLLSAAVLDGLQPDSFILGTLEFDVINLAPSVITQLSVLSGAVLADAFGSSLGISGLGLANVQGIPLPGTLFLVIVSLAALLPLRERQSA